MTPTAKASAQTVPQDCLVEDEPAIRALTRVGLAILLLGFLAAWAVLRRRRNQAPASPIYITAIHLPNGPGHEHIEFVQWQNPGTLETGQSTREAIVTWINSGGDLRVRDHGGLDVQVGVINGEPPYLRTHAGGVWTDSLLLLPRY